MKKHHMKEGSGHMISYSGPRKGGNNVPAKEHMEHGKSLDHMKDGGEATRRGKHFGEMRVNALEAQHSHHHQHHSHHMKHA